MIILPVEIQEILVRKLRNHVRIPAALHAIAGPGKQRIHHASLQNAVRRGKNSLHLVINDPIIIEFSVSALQFIGPAFLAENLIMYSVTIAGIAS